MGGKVDKLINTGNAPPIYRINGQNFHLIGSLLAQDGKKPKFAQLYIHDTQNEIDNRIAHSDEHNVLVKSFKLAKDEIDSNPRMEIKMRLIGKQANDARTYSLPMVSEVAYPILFRYGEDGYREDIQFTTGGTIRTDGRRSLKVEDRPDIVCRLFNLKLDCLIKELRSVVYTIEFQKRGLPHAHILLFMERTNQKSTANFMDSIISVEIPDKDVGQDYYNAVEEFMVHRPCVVSRSKSSCMVNGRCSKHFPKKFVDISSWDEDGNPIYRRWDDGRTILKNGVVLDNRYVVPHNRYLLLKYKTHINVEWCNQSRSIKYFFKYVNKENDRVTAEFYKNTTDEQSNEVIDEISINYDSKYISTCEATWRLFGFEVQFRTPPVERLSFHLPNCQLEVVWNAVWQYHSEDAQFNRRIGEYLILTDDAKKNFGLVKLEKLLQLYNKSLADFPHVPLPNFDCTCLVDNRLLSEKLAYDRAALHGYWEDISLEGLSTKLRSKGDIDVASSGIVSLLLLGGRIAHSRFAIQISLNEDSTCNISQGIVATSQN
ncbi:PREDICTED: uncharacterized protein LOC109160603 [Ipomoea nil]|uniref:uncharacterized protein LOC109160603 n=1 Tax=Ipomoea nil TaxID=35883 RepID=UPI000900ECBB|nr:PREDICTED: uncharacterized protein LOC109160603 [Ipomoea nil]